VSVSLGWSVAEEDANSGRTPESHLNPLHIVRLLRSSIGRTEDPLTHIVVLPPILDVSFGERADGQRATYGTEAGGNVHESLSHCNEVYQ
jgi:hypothetical protein